MSNVLFLWMFVSGSPVYNDISVKDSLGHQDVFRLPPMSSSCVALIKSSSSKEK